MNRMVVTTAALALLGAPVARVGPAAQAAPGREAASATGRYTKIANEINLTGRDLPGWKQTPDQVSPSEKADSDRIAQCVGTALPSKVDIVDVYSPYFDKGSSEITSDVTIVRARSDATSALRAMSSPKLVPCLKTVFLPYLKQQLPPGAKVTTFGMFVYRPKWSPPASFGYTISVGLSITAKASAPVNTSLTLDTIGFLVGRAEVELANTAQAARPDRRLEERLVAALTARAHRYASST